MGIIEQFTKLTETKLLLLEVSRGKRKALLEKISEKIFKDFGKLEIHERVVNLIETQPRLIEEMSKLAEQAEQSDGNKHLLADTINIQSDNVYERYPEFTFEIPEEYEGTEQATYGVDGLVACMVMFYKLERVDPTSNMKYGNWLIDVVLEWALEDHKIGHMGGTPIEIAFNLIRARRIFFEDLPKLESYLKAYDEAKKKNELPEEYRDINKIKPDDEWTGEPKKDPFEMMRAITAEYRAIETGDFFKAVESHLKINKDYEIEGELHNWIIYEPLTQKGASILGMNTEWCTTYGEHCTNPDYQGRSSPFHRYGDLLIMVNKKDPDIKYQMEKGGDQFMDKNDRYVNISELRENSPELFDFLLDKEYLLTPQWLKKEDGKIYIEDENPAKFMADFIEVSDVSDKFVETMLTGEGWEYFFNTGHVPNLVDIYLPKKAKTDKNLNIIKKKAYEIIADDPEKFQESEYTLEYLKQADFNDTLKIIHNVDLFDELRSAIKMAITDAEETANHDKAYNDLLEGFKDTWMVREIDWSKGRIYIEEDMIPDIIDWYNADMYNDEAEKRVTANVVQPYYGWRGEIHPETLQYALENRISEI